MFHKEIIDNQLFLYYKGKLIFKKWLTTGSSVVFDVMPYDSKTLISIT